MKKSFPVRFPALAGFCLRSAGSGARSVPRPRRAAAPLLFFDQPDRAAECLGQNAERAERRVRTAALDFDDCRSPDAGCGRELTDG